jgi:hypothetical protein
MGFLDKIFGGGKVKTIGGGVDPYIQPYVTDILQRGEAVSQQPFVPYTGERVAPLSPYEEAAFGGVAEQVKAGTAGTPYAAAQPYYDPAMSALGEAGRGISQYENLLGLAYPSLGAAQRQYGYAADIGRQMQPYIEQSREMIGASLPALSQAEREFGRAGDIYGEAGRRQREAARGITTGEMGQYGITGGDIERYMDPYQQQVIDIEKREARRQADIQAQDIGAAAAGMGGFGGSRQAILEAEAGRDLGQRLSDIQARGSQRAYEQALRTAQEQQRFGYDVEAEQRRREAGAASALGDIAAGRLGLGSTGYGGLFERGLGAAGAMGDLATLTGSAADVAGRAGAGYLDVAGGYGRAAQPYGDVPTQYMGLAGAYTDLGDTAFDRAMRELTALGTAGATTRDIEQRRLDAGYEEFMREQGYPSQALADYASLVYGVPLRESTTVQKPSFFQKALGTVTTLGGAAKSVGMPFKEGGHINSGISALAMGDQPKGTLQEILDKLKQDVFSKESRQTVIDDVLKEQEQKEQETREKEAAERDPTTQRPKFPGSSFINDSEYKGTTQPTVQVRDTGTQAEAQAAALDRIRQRSAYQKGGVVRYQEGTDMDKEKKKEKTILEQIQGIVSSPIESLGKGAEKVGSGIKKAYTAYNEAYTPEEQIRLGLSILAARPELGESKLGTVARGALAGLQDVSAERTARVDREPEMIKLKPAQENILVRQAASIFNVVFNEKGELVNLDGKPLDPATQSKINRYAAEAIRRAQRTGDITLGLDYLASIVADSNIPGSTGNVTGTGAGTGAGVGGVGGNTPNQVPQSDVDNIVEGMTKEN